MNDFLKTIAPTLASALLGPLGGVAVAGLGKIFGVQDATIDTVTEAFQQGKMTPEMIAEIKKLEMQLQADEKERGFKYAELEFKNTDSARKMQSETKSWFPAALSSAITLGFFGILGWMLYDDNIVNSEPVLIMLGSLGAAFGAVINFWLGTSHSSQVKNGLISKVAER
jgi:hypothetical protein